MDASYFSQPSTGTLDAFPKTLMESSTDKSVLDHTESEGLPANGRQSEFIFGDSFR